MASGPSAPSARPARSRPVAAVRPGALLTAAAAVPLGAAVLYAAGALDWIPRLLLGAALVVLGAAIWRTEGTITGARIGPRASRAIGMTVVVGGAVLVGGALAAAVGGRSPGTDWAPLPLYVALGAVGAWIARTRPTIGGVLVAIAAAEGWSALLGALGVEPTTEVVLTFLPAIALTVVTVRGTGPRPMRAGVGTAAALLIIGGVGEATGLSWLGQGLGDSTASGGDLSTGWIAAQLVLADIVAGVLLATAFVRRDAVGGALAGAALLGAAFLDGTTLRIASALIPVGALVLVSVALRSAELRRRLTAGAPDALRQAGWEVSTDVVRGAWAVALVICVANLWSPTDSWLAAALACVALLVATATAWSLRGTPGIVATSVALVGWATIQPVVVLVGGSTWMADGVTAAAIGLVVVSVMATVSIVRLRTSAVAAAGAFAVVGGIGLVLLTQIDFDGAVVWFLVTQLAPLLVVLLLASGCAVVGPARWVGHAQAVAAVVVASVIVQLGSLSSAVLSEVFGDESEPITDGARVALVLLLVTLAFGGALLAASTARRGSVVAVLGASASAFGTAVLAATLSAALVGPPTAGLVLDPNDLPVVPLAPLVGFDWHGGLLRFAEPGWPVIFGVVGLVLLGAAAWMESRRPLPAGAPIASADRD